MDRETIYLDNDEEITSVVDKLKSAEMSSLDIVIPKEALLLQSVVNLKLLKKQADTLSKDITIVTQDKVGKKLAEQIGIPVVAKPGQVVQTVKMSEEPNVSENDIEIKEDTPEEKTPEPKKEEAVPEEKPKAEPSKKKPKGKRWKKWAIIGGFATLLVLVAGYIWIPLATVNVQLAAEKKKVDLSFTVDKSYSEVDTGNITIPGRLISEDKETAEKYPATGKKTVGTKATGTVKISNGYSTTPQIIVSGTRVVSNSLIFRTQTNVTVPGYTKPGADIIPGTATVSVTADKVGDQYNMTHPTHFTIPAAESTIYADTTAAFTGGTSKDVTYVTQTDINEAKAKAAKSVEAELKKLALEKTEREERLLDGAVKITQTSAEPSAKVGDEVSEFEMKSNSNVQAIVFLDENLRKLAENSLSQEIGDTKEIVEKEALLSSTEFVSADFKKGQMQARLSGEAYVATKLDEGKIKTELSGEAESGALTYLNGIDGIDSAEIKFFPDFYKRIPRIGSHIYIKVSLSKVQEDQSQDEVPSP